MTREKIIASLLIMFILPFFSITEAALSESPLTSIRSTIDEVLETLRDKTLAQPKNKEKRREKITNLIKSRFDFEEMSKRILGRYWKDRTEDEQKEFISLFSELLEASYIRKIESYTNEKVTYDNESIKADRYGVVSTSIITAKTTIPIDYKVILKDNKWWVYDVVIEGVSFITTYRNQYNKIITSESYAQLIKKMNEKLKEVRKD
ncbi:MAG: ABC transporter substrate-binding protein [Nitrospirota bacterium]